MPTLTLGIDASRARAGAREFQRAAKDAGDAARDASEQVRGLEDRLKSNAAKVTESGAALRRARIVFGESSSEVARLSAEYERFGRSLTKSQIAIVDATERATSARRRYVDSIKAGIEAERLGSARGRPSGGVEAIRSVGALGTSLGPIGGQVASFTLQAEGAGAAIGGIAGVAGLSSTALLGLGAAFTATAAVTAAAISANLDFERSLKGLNALLDSSSQLEERRQSIYAQSYRSGQSTEEVARAQEIITRQFRGDAAAIEAVTRASESFAAATGTQVSAAAQVLAQAIDGFKIKADDAGEAVSRLFTSARAGNQEFLPFAGALGTLGDEARAAGVGFGQLSVVLARASSETNLGEATSAMRRFLIALTDETDPATQKLRALGAQFERLPDGSRDLAQAIGEIQRVTGGKAEVLSGIFGNRDFPTVFAALSTDLGQVAGAAKVARSEVDALNAAIGRQENSNASRFDKVKSSTSAAFSEFGGELLSGESLIPGVGIVNGFEKILSVVRSLGSEVERVAESTQSIKPPVVAEFEKLRASVAQLNAGPVDAPLAGESKERDRARASYRAFSDEILRLKPIGFPIDVAIEKETAEVRDAFESIRRAASIEATPVDVAEAVSQIDALDGATRRLEASNKSRSAALDAENEKVLAGRSAADQLIKSIEAEGAAIGLTSRELAGLRVVRDAERVASSTGIALKDSEIQKLKDLALANFDAAAASKLRSEAEARSSIAQKSYSGYVDSLREQVQLLKLTEQGLTEQEIAISEGVRRAQELADAFREAQLAAGADPRTVANLIPDQSATIGQVRTLVEEIERLKSITTEDPIAKYGAFVPEPKEREQLGPEYDQGASDAFSRLQDLQGGLSRERELLGLSSDERERALFLRDAENEAIRAGIQDREGLIAEMGREFEEFQKLRGLDQLGKDVGQSLASGFEDAIFQAKSFNGAIRDIGREIAQLAFRQAVTGPLSNSLGSLFGGLFGGLGGGAGAGAGGAPPSGGGGIFARGGVFERGSVVPFAQGGVFERSRLVPFAAGGIFDQPTYFPMSQGRTGMMGEAGPEAIMPLTRGPDGKLGVRSDGSGSSSSVSNVSNTTSVSMTVVAKDADSFRRSSRQITSDLKRRL